jgi:hypothetical protein
MPELNKDWVVSQLQDAKVPKQVGDAVISLINHWENIKINDKNAKQAIEIFSKLSLNTALTETNSNSEVWVPARPGAIKVGDIMMVLPDAYDHPELAPMHNGRRGRVVRISYGNIVLTYIDGKLPEVGMAHHSPHHLQKLVS